MVASHIVFYYYVLYNILDSFIDILEAIYHDDKPRNLQNTAAPIAILGNNLFSNHSNLSQLGYSSP